MKSGMKKTIVFINNTHETNGINEMTRTSILTTKFDSRGKRNKNWLLVALLCVPLILLGRIAFADEKLHPLVADLYDLPDDLKAQFQELDENQRRYLIQILLGYSHGNTLTQGSTVVLGRVSVDQVISETAFIGKYAGTSIWVTGVNADSLTDDSTVSMVDLALHVDGTQSYTTVLGGSKTIVKLQAFSTESAKEIMQALLMRRGYRLFRINGRRKKCHVHSVARLSATVTYFNEKKPIRVLAEAFSPEDKQWLTDRDNISAMKKAKREWDAAHPEEPDKKPE